MFPKQIFKYVRFLLKSELIIGITFIWNILIAIKKKENDTNLFWSKAKRIGLSIIYLWNMKHPLLLNLPYIHGYKNILQRRLVPLPPT